MRARQRLLGIVGALAIGLALGLAAASPAAANDAQGNTMVHIEAVWPDSPSGGGNRDEKSDDDKQESSHMSRTEVIVKVGDGR